MKKYNNASYPPHGPWDRRLTEAVCTSLVPVEELHRNDWFVLRRRGNYYTMEYHTPQVIVLPVVDDEAIVMVRVKRPVLSDSTLELPAGGSMDGEAPEASASRELAEETGIEVSALSRFVPMPPLAISPNRMPRLVYVFRIALTRKEFDQRRPHDDEIEGVELVSLDEAVRLMTTGGLYVAIPMAIISMYLLARK
jgi:8-oxo-dGTP pyrophosphatase MutT (NUDIX family)